MSKQHEDYRSEYEVGEVVATKEEKAAQTEEERVAAEKAELAGKERVRDKVARLVGELRGGQGHLDYRSHQPLLRRGRGAVLRRHRAQPRTPRGAEQYCATRNGSRAPARSWVATCATAP